MILAKTIEEMRAVREEAKGSLGFVPTMGYLHDGHMSLVKKAREDNATVAVSIFVNPTQFGPREDFKSYPRNTKRDLAMLEPLTDIVFMPSDKEMYPKDYNSWVEVKGLTDVLEGAVRPGHFLGVTTVVAKLFNIVAPDKAYFGQKDAQQVAVIKKMVKDLDMDLEVVTCPTLREKDGLAMSSRNTYLNGGQRKGAAVLYKALVLAQELVSGGEKDAGAVRLEMKELIDKESQANIEYISVADNETLKEIHRIKLPVLVSMAVKFGKTRLIDNIVLE